MTREHYARPPAHTLIQIEPLLVMLKLLNEQIKAADRQLEETAKTDEVVRQLCGVPGVDRCGENGESHSRERSGPRILQAYP